MIPTRTAAAHMGLAHHRCPLMSRVHPRASGADPPKWLGADRRDHRSLLPLSTCLSLPVPGSKKHTVRDCSGESAQRALLHSHEIVGEVQSTKPGESAADG